MKQLKYILKADMSFTVIGSYKAPRMRLQELEKEMSHLVTHHELLRGCVIIENVNINVKKSNTLCDYMENTYGMHQWVQSAITHEETIIDLLYENT